MTTPDKRAETVTSVHDLIARRHSPRAFDPNRLIEQDKLLSMLEAARWTASSSNLQPWRFIVARKQDSAEFDKLLSVIKEGNIPWAKHAGALVLGVVHKYRREDVLNRHASHDLGQSIAQMVLQALDHDIYARQMGGFYPDKARELYSIPEEYEPFTAIAFGYKTSDLSHLTDAHREAEMNRRERLTLDQLVFGGSWAQTADFID